MKTRILIIIITAVLIGSGCYNDGCEEYSSQEIHNRLTDEMKFKLNFGDTLIYRSLSNAFDTAVVRGMRFDTVKTTGCIGNMRTDIYSEKQDVVIFFSNRNFITNQDGSYVYLYSEYPSAYFYVSFANYGISTATYTHSDLISGDSIFRDIYYVANDSLEIWANKHYGIVGYRKDSLDLFIINEVKQIRK